MEKLIEYLLGVGYRKMPYDRVRNEKFYYRVVGDVVVTMYLNSMGEVKVWKECLPVYCKKVVFDGMVESDWVEDFKLIERLVKI